MPFRILARQVAALCLGGAVLVALSGTALAHERRDVGKYQFVVGFAAEPAFEGTTNGASLRVTNRETNAPVTGLEQTLQVEIHHGEADTTRSLRAVFGTPGLYQADFIPTAPGVYEFHFKGTVEGLPVEEEFVSGPGRFNDVNAATEFQFPEPLPSMREVAGVARSSQEAVQAASNAAAEAGRAAATARTLALIGIGAGVVGVLVGAGGIAAGMRRR